MIFTILIGAAKVLFVTFIILLLVLYFYFRKQYQYWATKKVLYRKPIFPFGNMMEAIRKPNNEAFKKLYDESKHQKFQGIWLMHKPVLMVNDPDLIHQILIKSFPNFQNHGSYFDKKHDPFSENLFNVEGEKWKNLRAKLSPIFTSRKLKEMMPSIMKCSKNLQNFLTDHTKKNRLIDATDLTFRFTTGVVLSVVFGIEMNFLKTSRSFVHEQKMKVFKPGWVNMMKWFFAAFMPEIGKKLKYSIDYFIQMIQDIVSYRKKNSYERNDMMQFLMQLLEKGNNNDVTSWKDGNYENVQGERFTFQDLATQGVSFLLGGFETTTTTIQFALYELAKNQGIQKKLKREINKVLARHAGQITYDAISEMEYLTRIVDETLRMYPVVPTLPRKCNTEFKDSISNLKIEKEEYVIIPISGIYWDDRYYPEPEKFDPERFTTENKASRPHCSYIPFGDGPRVCIGQRFALLQIKIGLVTILSGFDFTLSEEFTPNPLKIEPKSIITTPKDKIVLEISPSNTDYV